MTTAAPASDLPVPPGRRRLIATAMIVAGAMQGMDTFASAVALPQIRGVMSASIDEAAWILTSYLVASAIFTPLYAWLSKRFGRKRLLMLVIFGFFVSTLLVAQSSSLNEIVFFRFVQGMVAAGLNPLSQQILLAAYPREMHGTAFGWMTTGRMTGVILGPLVGGVLTEFLSWHWVYLSNVPICILGLYLVGRFVPESEERTAAPRFDVFGFIALSVAIGSMQLMLDRGERQGWFESTEIVIWAGLLAAALYLFIIHVITARNAYINPRIFMNRDFVIGIFFVFILAFMIFGYAGLLPPILQQHMNYPVSTSGLLMVPRGVGTMFASIVAGAMLLRYPPRPLVVVGIFCMAGSTYLMSRFTPDVDALSIMAIVCLQGVGFGFFSVAVTAMAFQTLPAILRPDGTSIISLFRRLGASVGVSVLVSQLVRSTQESRGALMENISLYNDRLRHLTLPERWDTGTLPGLVSLEREVEKQAEFLAYLHDFRLMTVLILLLLPLVFLLRGRRD